MKRFGLSFLALFLGTLFPHGTSSQSLSWQPTGGPTGGEVTGLAEGEAGTLFSSTSQGIYVSNDRGGSWQLTLALQTTSVLYHPSGRVFAGSVGSGTYCSTDNGNSWWHSPASPETVWNLSLDHDGRMIAGSNGRIAILENGEWTWTTVLVDAPEVFSVVFKPGGTGLLATNGGGAFVSADTGKTWTQSNAGFDDLRIQDLAIAPDGDLYAATRTGVFRTTDDGESWNRISPDWGATVHKVAVTHAGQLFAAVHTGVYSTLNKGAEWTQLNDGLTIEITGALLVATDGYVYVGTWGSGVFRSSTRPDPFVHNWLCRGKPGDGFGMTVASAGDLNSDGWPDVVVGSPYSDVRGPSSGSATVYFGGPGLFATPGLVFFGRERYDLFGFSVAGVGDVNGDGYDDIAVGAPTDYSPRTAGKSQSRMGKAYVFFGSAQMDTIPDVVLSNGAPSGFGSCVSAAGDVNGDGRPDILVGDSWEPLNSLGWKYPVYWGRVHVLLGISEPGFEAGPVLGSFHGFGTSFGKKASGIGDFDRDGFDDVAATSWITTDPPPAFDFVICRGGSPMDSIDDRMISGDLHEVAYFPSALSAGDFNGDHSSDIVAPSPGESGYYGPIDAKVCLYMGGTSVEGSGRRTFLSPKRGIGYATGAACVGDISADGFDDLVAGTSLDNTGGQESGGALIYLGGAPLDTLADGSIAGGAPFDRLGSVIARAGDYDGDGWFEVPLGSPGSDPGGIFPGRVYLAKTGLAIPVVPSSPILASPPDGSVGQPRMTSVQWQRCQNTLWYHCQVSTDSLFQTIVFEWSNVIDTTTTIGPLDSATTYYWRVRAHNLVVSSTWSLTWEFRTALTGVAAERGNVPAHYSLAQNYPNPFNPTTTIRFELPKSSEVVLAVYDVLGCEVSVLVAERRNAGVHEVTLDASALASGVYFYRLQASGFVETKKLLVTK